MNKVTLISIVRLYNGGDPKGTLMYTKDGVKQLFELFYEKVKHGDDEHQKWLKDETDSFVEEYITNEKTFDK